MGILNHFSLFRKEKVETLDVQNALIVPAPEEKSVVRSLFMTSNGERHKFAEYLFEKRLAAPEHIKQALLEQNVTQERIGTILVRNGFMPQDLLVTTILEYQADRIATERVANTRIPIQELELNNIIISAETATHVYVGTMADEDYVRDLISRYYPEKEIHFVAFLPEILPEFHDRMRRIELGETDDDVKPEEMLEKLIYQGLRDGASDIHIEPHDHSYSVFYRKLGVRDIVHEGGIDEYNTVVSQLKDRSKMDLAERRVGQDGGYQVEYAGNFVDLRVATVPSVGGEQAIIRILDPSKVRPKLESVGVTEYKIWQNAIRRPNGLCLICGPTGSGKTTTLNATIRELDRFGKKIYTVEDPVEYRIPFVAQVSTNPQVGLTFARSLKNFMRADPDVIVLGEIRDSDVARIAVQAADTGHLVMATLHTGSIVSSLTRLRDLGVSSYELRYILRSVLVQTLVRVICPICEGTGAYNDHICLKCKGSGFSDRTVVSECVGFNEFREVDTVISMTEKGSGVDKFPWHDMVHDGIQKMLAGLTTFDELQRIFGSEVEIRLEQMGVNPNDYILKKNIIIQS